MIYCPYKITRLPEAKVMPVTQSIDVIGLLLFHHPEHRPIANAAAESADR